jgi:nitroreductase
MKDVFDQAKQRRSIRGFAEEVLSRAEIDSLLEAARIAPSAVNLQPTRVFAVTHPADLAVIRSAAYGVGACATAPCVLVSMIDLTADSHLGERVEELTAAGALEPLDMSSLTSGAGRPFQLKVGREVALINCAIATAYMDLQAVTLGLGTCWVHHADFRQIADHFSIPDHLEIVTLLAVGHPIEFPLARPRAASLRWEPEPEE